MHKIIDNFKNIQNQINSKISELKINNYIPNIVAVSKTFNITHINPLIDYGHEHFGENKVQEALNKWSDITITHQGRNRNSFNNFINIELERIEKYILKGDISKPHIIWDYMLKRTE